MMSRDVPAESATSALMRALASWLPVGRSRRSSRRRVLRWCRRHGFELRRWRVAKLFEGPSSWDPGHTHYRVQVVDASGRERGAYLTFARVFVFDRCVQVLWDDPPGFAPSRSAPR